MTLSVRRPHLGSILDQEGVREETGAGVLRPGLPPPASSARSSPHPQLSKASFIMACAPYDEGCINTSARKL